ncbi:MAG: TetR/AcrR family transcriptional regulator [Cyanobacteria bacterium P01_H01_bin.21]
MTQTKGGAQPAVGRPRSAESQQAILTAAWQLLKTCSLRKLSIESIAREASVGKTTIYRWWPSKTAVVVDSFLAQVEASLPFPKTETAAASLMLQMQQVAKVLSGDIGRIVAQIVAEGQCDSEALESFRERFLNPRRAAARQVILQGIESGEFAPDLDADLAMDILYGPIYYRLLVKHLPLDEAFASALPKQAVGMLAANTDKTVV